STLSHLHLLFLSLLSFHVSTLSFLIFFFFYYSLPHRSLHSFPTRRSSDLIAVKFSGSKQWFPGRVIGVADTADVGVLQVDVQHRSEEHTSELQSRSDLVCRLLLEKKKKKTSKKLIS